MLDREYEFFKKNLPQLLNQYKDLFLVIKDEEVIGHFDTYDKALSFGLSKYKLGEFLVQQCIDEDDSTAQFFNSYFLMR